MKSTITLYQRPNTRGQKNGADGFTKKFIIAAGDTDKLALAVESDNCPVRYANGYRKGTNFLSADNVLADIDNTHSDAPEEWITLDDVLAVLHGVEFYYYPSRNHMKPKGEKGPRPKYHFIFPTHDITSVDEYTGLMKKLIASFPSLHFDESVRSPAQMNFGVEAPQVSYVEGEQNLSDFLDKIQATKTKPIRTNSGGTIPEGQRHSTLVKYAASVLTRLGDEDSKSYEAFIKKADKCVPSLEENEVDSIWNSSVSYYRNTIRTDPDYIPPEEFAPQLRPDDYSDTGQAAVLKQEHGEEMRHSAATLWIVYNGTIWEESLHKAKGRIQAMTKLQLADARKAYQAAVGDEDKEERAKRYIKFVIRCRNAYGITSTLFAAEPMLEISVDCFDRDPHLLNTPDGTIDLRTGTMRPHSPKDYCTKCTTVEPGDNGAALWSQFLETITCGDRELADYLQAIAGQAAIGKVYAENLIIAYGMGRNGKSTFFNVLAQVLSDYSGSLSAETLTTNCRKNKSPEIAELRGMRLVLAAELEEGTRLDTAAMKKLCSTDAITAEKKYKDPFKFIPSHTTVLFTNHLPKVGTTDIGTWRRLVVVPFNAVIKGDKDIKNYAEYLFNHAGGAILSWIIEGARKFIAAGYKIDPPECVKRAIEEYRGANDWVSNYISERCVVGKTYQQQSGELYEDHRDYCERTGEYKRSAADFKAALVGAGYEWRRTKTGGMYYGLRLSQPSQPSPASPLHCMELFSEAVPSPRVNLADIGFPVPAPLVTEGDGEIQNFSESNTEF